ncbi:MAG: carboxypeptidase regulatory-like domain-containing protein [Anaerolineae bacterium]|nr:carboxypeptidase regulatory-like domain-containing protein [Anaerolineae bacterium]
MITKNRTLISLFALLAVVMMALAACGSDDSGSDVVARPEVHLQVNDQVYRVSFYSYCWPEAANNLDCDVNAAALSQPGILADVVAGDEVQFVVAGDVGAPQQFTATLLDGPGGVQNLGTSTSGIYNAELVDGFYRVRVDAEYADIEGQQAYVSYVYGLNVSGVVVAVPTAIPTSTPEPSATPTVTPTATLTQAPTLTPTPEITATPTPEPTSTPTSGPIEEPTEEPAELATENVVETAEPAATEEETPPTIETVEVAVASPEVTVVGDLGEKTVFGTVLSGDNNEPVAGVSVSYSHSSIVNTDISGSGTVQTDFDGRFLVGPLFLHDTDQIVVSVEAAGYDAQRIQRSGLETWTNPQFDIVLVLSGIAAPAAGEIETAAAPGPAPELSLPGEIPELKLTFAGKDFTPVGYQYCRRIETGERICVESPVPETMTRRVRFQRGAPAQLRLDDDRPDTVRIEYLSDTGVPTGTPETQSGDNLVLFTVSPEPGTYILSVRFVWGSEDATYFFRVIVTD